MGEARTGLRLRRLRLEDAAVRACSRDEMLEQATRDREAAAGYTRRAKELRGLATEKVKNRFGWEKKNLTDSQRTAAIRLAQDREQKGRVRMGREDALRPARRLRSWPAACGLGRSATVAGPALSAGAFRNS
jgi:hypothetical protein